MDDGFDWDDAKAEANYRKHSITFEMATEAFADPSCLEGFDPFSTVHGEDRFLIIGMAGGQLLTVIYAERGDVIRLISARKASRREHDSYYRQNSQE